MMEFPKSHGNDAQYFQFLLTIPEFFMGIIPEHYRNTSEILIEGWVVLHPANVGSFPMC